MKEKTIIISRHKGAINWLKKYHSEFNNVEYFTHVNKKDIKGNIVIGTLPINLAIFSKEYWHLSMDIPIEMRGKELSIKDMEEFNCKIEGFIIKRYCEHEKSHYAGQCYVCDKCMEPTRFI